MFRTLIAAVTLVALLACPFRCAAGVCGDAGTDHPSCRCCPSSPTPCDDAPDSPADPGECGCQGICGGAVLPDDVDLPVLATWTLVAFSTDDLAPERLATHSPDRADRDVARSLRSGMLLRVAISSLLN